MALMRRPGTTSLSNAALVLGRESASPRSRQAIYCSICEASCEWTPRLLGLSARVADGPGRAGGVQRDVQIHPCERRVYAHSTRCGAVPAVVPAPPPRHMGALARRCLHRARLPLFVMVHLPSLSRGPLRP